MSILKLLIGVISLLISSITCADTPVTCTAGDTFDIKTNKTNFYQEKYFRILNVFYNDLPKKSTWQKFSQQSSSNNVIGYQANNGDLGYVNVIIDWAMYQFRLTSIILTNKPQNSIDGITFDAEIQFRHELVPKTLPGRQVHLGTNGLVISVLLKKSDSSALANQTTQLFNYTNLASFKNGGKDEFVKPIKIRKLINHMPCFLYSTTTYFDLTCNQTFWQVQGLYNYITDFDLKNLNEAITYYSSNPFLSLIDSTTTNVIRNNRTYTPIASFVNYNNSKLNNVSLMIMFVILMIYLAFD